MGELVKARVIVKGRVQGVFYRQSTKDVAQRLGLGGWVKNQNDGTVAIEAIGSRDKVDELIKWCHKGPPSARVDHVDVEWETAPAEAGARFQIL